MTVHSPTETATATYVSVAKENWQPFFDAFSKVIVGTDVEIEVVAPELGDQIEAGWLALNGLTYDHKADTFYVYVESADGVDHAIAHPREILVRHGARGLEQVVVIDSDARQHIVRLREPLLLPEHVG